MIVDDRWEPRVLSITDPTMPSTWGPHVPLSGSPTTIPLAASTTPALS